MRELKTIQKREKLNRVFAIGEEGPGGAYHRYRISCSGGLEIPIQHVIRFQEGPRMEYGSIPGVIDSDLLEIVRDRLRSFQEGDFRCRENACALIHIEEALMWMNRRIEDRIEREVLGTNNK